MKPNTKRKEMSLWQVRELFLIDQKAKGSSKATIVVYHRVFVNLAKWLAFETAALLCEELDCRWWRYFHFEEKFRTFHLVYG